MGFDPRDAQTCTPNHEIPLGAFSEPRVDIYEIVENGQTNSPNNHRMCEHRFTPD